ncbi:MAG TPA: hypothetical protein ENI05_12880 [Porticoccus sp.]|nr:hypothetical protein [Porticoccus sp.]
MALAKNESGIIDEMSIVDVFTKLIFDADSVLDESENLIIELLAQADSSMVDASRRDISEFLRSMAVDEMITVVGQVKRRLDQQQGIIAANKSHHRHSLRR